MSYITSKIQQLRSGNRLHGKLLSDIGPEGIIGAKNLGIYSKNLKDMIRSGKQFEAVEYSKQEAEKVRKQVYEDRARKALNYKEKGYK